AAEHAAQLDGRHGDRHGRQSRDRCEEASATPFRRSRLDRDESAGKGARPALRHARQLRRRHRTLHAPRGDPSTAAFNALQAQKARTAQPRGGGDYPRSRSSSSIGTAVATWQAFRATNAEHRATAALRTTEKARAAEIEQRKR